MEDKKLYKVFKVTLFVALVEITTNIKMLFDLPFAAQILTWILAAAALTILDMELDKK